jgi:hypothetical protein
MEFVKLSGERIAGTVYRSHQQTEQHQHINTIINTTSEPARFASRFEIVWSFAKAVGKSTSSAETSVSLLYIL